MFATYRTGGLDNLNELLHETGHAAHLAAIRTRPAFRDWPDSDPFTEAVADVAALDVYEHEPEVPEALLGLENITLLPHLGSATIETRTAMGLLAVENLFAGLGGQRPRCLVNPEVLDR